MKYTRCTFSHDFCMKPCEQGPWLLRSEKFRAYYEHPLALPPLSLSYVQFKRWQNAVRTLKTVLPTEPVARARGSVSLEQWAWFWGVERWLHELRSHFPDVKALLAFFAEREQRDVVHLPMLTPIAQYKFALAAQAVASPSLRASAVLPSTLEERRDHDNAAAAPGVKTKTETVRAGDIEGDESVASDSLVERDRWALQLLPSIVPSAEQRLRELALLVQRLHDLLKQAEVAYLTLYM